MAGLMNPEQKDEKDVSNSQFGMGWIFLDGRLRDGRVACLASVKEA